MIRAEYARIIPVVTLHFKGLRLGKRRSLKRGRCIFFLTCHICNKMSDVRLSNASPTLERGVDARQPDHVRPTVRRNLFGRPDSEEIRRYVTASIQEDVERFTETYNFDPVEERPLAARNYEWEEDSDAPEFYVRPPSNRQDAGESSARPAEQPGNDASRKRRPGPPDSCSSECQSKRSHTDEDDDDEDQSAGAGRPSRPENSAEVQ
ncbi:cyclin-dependent kinase inhibitor 1B-like [Sebastes umbrosus]|uniref:cyclin-dependent kinase inhibitor 1B-like n=1 Tax=Sebastes umbrosus TaxID=72105 RepID=UPI00189FC7C3|nr:cyclin-dependent kinase inhibitor 1B-like [Sebastes umbrosus]